MGRLVSVRGLLGLGNGRDVIKLGRGFPQGSSHLGEVGTATAGSDPNRPIVTARS